MKQNNFVKQKQIHEYTRKPFKGDEALPESCQVGC